ncbi:MAG TPA: hypothetical protein VIE90_18775 [Candidatus Binatia bacterium]|jgi:hypothetical protein
MKKAKQVISGAALFASVFALATPAFADWRDRNHAREYRGDLRDLRNARRELRQDLRRGAGPGEIARDRAAIARERRELRQHRFGWNDRDRRSRYARYRYDNDRNRHWNRWDRRDQGRHRGWWR